MTTFDASDFHLDQPGAMIADLPAVLGFVPEQSLVLATFELGEMGCVMRVDLSADLPETVAHLAKVAAANGPASAVAVIVDDDGASCRMCMDDHRELVATLDDDLEVYGIDLLAAYVVDRLEAGGRWHCVDDHSWTGIIADPMSTPMAAAAVLDGRRLYTRRAELQDVVAAADPPRTAALSATMPLAGHDGAMRPAADAREDVEHVLAVARGLDTGPALTDDELTRLGWALTDPRVRDTLYALAVGRDAGPAESLWAVLARTLPPPWRTEALALLAFSAYARGDGPLAGVSLDAALRSDPGHRMASMLDQALQSGMRPNQIRELAQTGYRLAKQLGVRLPPRTSSGRRVG